MHHLMIMVSSAAAAGAGLAGPGPNASCRIAGVPYFGWETCLPQTFWENGVPLAYQKALQASLAEADLDGPEPEAGQ